MTPAQVRIAIEAKILLEASKPRGVTFHELRDRRDVATSVSRNHCRRMARDGRLFTVRVKHGRGIRWFAKKADASAFDAAQAIPRRRHGVADFPVQRQLVGSTLSFDKRYQVDPALFTGGEFTAEWHRLRGC